MTILRLAHLDAEGLVLDAKVRSLRDSFVTHNWTELVYNGLYFSPEREFLENSLLFSQKRVVSETYSSLQVGNQITARSPLGSTTALSSNDVAFVVLLTATFHQPER